jgi:NAD-dependent deacetylase
MKQINELQNIINHAKHIVFFTGAGVSTDSGIPDFRSTDGLYNMKYDFPPETIISHSFFMDNPEEFYRFYRDKMIYPDARPSIAHHFIAKCEAKGISSGVITQNIDGLHTSAGSKNVIELHGSVLRNTCMKCGKKH